MVKYPCSDDAGPHHRFARYIRSLCSACHRAFSGIVLFSTGAATFLEAGTGLGPTSRSVQPLQVSLRRPTARGREHGFKPLVGSLISPSASHGSPFYPFSSTSLTNASLIR